MGGTGIHYSLKNLPIIHLIKMFAFSLKSIPLFIKILIFSSLFKNSICIIVCFLAFFPACLRPLGWFFNLIGSTYTLGMITYMAFISILLCPIAVLVSEI